MEYFDYISESDRVVKKLQTKIKVQEKMLGAYDEEIKSFNKKIRQKKKQ